MTELPRILDMYCGDGGAAMGYHQAGFEVVGIDIRERHRFPFRYVQGSVLKLRPAWIRKNFQVVHASPPCQAHTTLKVLHSDGHHKDYLPQTRELLEDLGLPYIIENVPGAPLIDPLTLCGSSFGLTVRRHRLFEFGGGLELEGLPCEHSWQSRHQPYPQKRYHNGEVNIRMAGHVGVYGGGQGLGEGEVTLWKVAMGIDWMGKEGLAQAIPPAYTRYLGKQVLAQLS